MARPLPLVFAFACAAGCASAGRTPLPLAVTVSDVESTPLLDPLCATCGARSLDTEVTRAIEKQVADLKALGGDCSSIGAVLETSHRSGQITIRPFMWRVGSQLASGEARPNGDMILAREIDSLNVGVRTLDDLLWSMEHEAAHIAFKIAPPPGHDASEDRANDYVRACKQELESSVRSRDIR